MNNHIRLPDGRDLDLRYFVEWRPYLWAKPLARIIQSLGNIEGKRVLEIGGRSGRMTSLFAMLGANVTMAEWGSVAQAKTEVEKWGIPDRVQLISTDGTLDQLPKDAFDIVFTKSVLWCIADLNSFLAAIDERLKKGGKIAFLENVRGGAFMFWLRRNLVHRRKTPYLDNYHGIRKDQFEIFQRYFDSVQIRRHLLTIYEITGMKRSQSG
jgi:protein-L-isoaspartate O-methyltransferase